MRDPKPLGELVRTLIERYRLADPDTWSRLQREWSELAGEPWSTRSTPRSLQDGKLVVEATTAASVGVLRYGTTSLVARLAEELGDGVVTQADVVPPRRP